MLGRILGSIERIAQAAVDVVNARAKALTSLGQTALWATVGLVILITLAILFVVSPTAGVALAAVLVAGYWLYTRE